MDPKTRDEVTAADLTDRELYAERARLMAAIKRVDPYDAISIEELEAELEPIDDELFARAMSA